MNAVSQKYFALFVVIVNIALVALLFDRRHVILFSLLIPLFFWFASLTSMFTDSQYFDPVILNTTSLISIVGFGFYAYELTHSVMRYWFLAWYTLFVLIFVNVVFKYRYRKGNDLGFFVFEFLLLFIWAYFLTFTDYVPWNIVWILVLPVPTFVVLLVFENFSRSYVLQTQNYVLLKAVLGSLAILSTGYIGLYADVSPESICVKDPDCPHGSSKSGTGEFVDDFCYCLDSTWFKSKLGLCLPCSNAYSTAVDCCNQALTYDNIKTLSCGAVNSNDTYQCVKTN